MQSAVRIRLLIADDHALVRSGLRMLLRGYPDMEVVGEAGTGGEAIDRAETLHPDVVLLDHTMPGMSGFTALGEIRRRVPSTRVLMVTMHENDAYLREALQVGASGYMIKRADESDLVAGVRAVARGEIYVHPALTVYLVDRVLNRKAESVPQPAPSRLSARKRAVLSLLAQGHTSREIADQLRLSSKTVDTYRSRIVRELGLTSRAELVRYAVANHLVSFGE